MTLRRKPCSNSSQEYINGFVYDKYVKKKYVNLNAINPMDSLKGAKTITPELSNTMKEPKQESNQPGFNFDFHNVHVKKEDKKEDYNQFSEPSNKFPALQRAQS